MQQVWDDAAWLGQVDYDHVEGVVEAVWSYRHPHQVTYVRSPTELPDVCHILLLHGQGGQYDMMYVCYHGTAEDIPVLGV